MMREWQQVKSNLLLLLIPFTLIALFIIFTFSPLRNVFPFVRADSLPSNVDVFLVPLAAIGILAVGRKLFEKSLLTLAYCCSIISSLIHYGYPDNPIYGFGLHQYIRIIRESVIMNVTELARQLRNQHKRHA